MRRGMREGHNRENGNSWSRVIGPYVGFMLSFPMTIGAWVIFFLKNTLKLLIEFLPELAWRYIESLRDYCGLNYRIGYPNEAAGEAIFGRSFRFFLRSVLMGCFEFFIGIFRAIKTIGETISSPIQTYEHWSWRDNINQGNPGPRFENLWCHMRKLSAASSIIAWASILSSILMIPFFSALSPIVIPALITVGVVVGALICLNGVAHVMVATSGFNLRRRQFFAARARTVSLLETAVGCALQSERLSTLKLVLIPYGIGYDEVHNVGLVSNNHTVLALSAILQNSHSHIRSRDLAAFLKASPTYVHSLEIASYQNFAHADANQDGTIISFPLVEKSHEDFQHYAHHLGFSIDSVIALDQALHTSRKNIGEGFFFVAVWLLKNKIHGDLVAVILSYLEPRPSVQYCRYVAKESARIYSNRYTGKFFDLDLTKENMLLSSRVEILNENKDSTFSGDLGTPLLCSAQEQS